MLLTDKSRQILYTKKRTKHTPRWEHSIRATTPATQKGKKKVNGREIRIDFDEGAVFHEAPHMRFADLP